MGFKFWTQNHWHATWNPGLPVQVAGKFKLNANAGTNRDWKKDSESGTPVFKFSQDASATWLANEFSRDAGHATGRLGS